MIKIPSQASGVNAVTTTVSSDVLTDYFNYIKPAKGYYSCTVVAPDA